MKLYAGNIADYIGRVSAICITTNGFVKNNGECVMGRGIAKQFATIDPFLPVKLGNHIKTNGNVVGVISEINGTDIISFPVKPVGIYIENENDIQKVISWKQKDFPVFSTVPGFWCKADLNIIQTSCDQLITLKEKNHYKYMIMPLPGCGAGELSYVKDVQSILTNKFGDDDEIYVMSFNKEDFEK